MYTRVPNIDLFYTAMLASQGSQLNSRRVSTLNALEPFRIEFAEDNNSQVDPYLQELDWALERGIRESQTSIPAVKKVLSQKGKSMLKKVLWTKGMDSSCPITCDDFTEGQTVTQLPCKHCFQSQAISKWVSENDASCPVCRAPLPHKEVSDLPASPTGTHHDDANDQPGWIGVTTFSFEISY